MKEEEEDDEGGDEGEEGRMTRRTGIRRGGTWYIYI